MLLCARAVARSVENVNNSVGRTFLVSLEVFHFIFSFLANEQPAPVERIKK